jgi:CubicO group peptidase (beta-lactamase class C family)
VAQPFFIGICVALVGSSAVVAAPSVTQRIEHIQQGLLPPLLISGQAPRTTDLASRMKELRVPGVSVAVIHDGKLEWARGFGVTRVGGPPVTEDTLFQAASISKPVFATAVMSLVQSGKLDLDTDVNGYLKSWKVPGNEFTRETKVTLRELLTHAAGVNVHGFAGYKSGAPEPTLVQVLDGVPPANNDPIRVVALPGKEANYSGGGFIIAQQVVSDVTGIPFPKLMHDLVLAPYGMKSSNYEQPLSHDLLERAAIPYRDDGSPVPGGPHVYPEFAAAGLWTTPTDLARYAIGLQQALAGKSGRVLSSKTANEMLVPVFGTQAIGLRMGGSPAHPTFSHGGANAGYRCILIAYETGDGAVVMTNGDNGDALMDDLVRTIAHEYGWPDYQPVVRTLVALDPGAFDRYAGAYRLPSGQVVTFWRDRSSLNSRIWGDPPVQLFPSSEREFFAATADLRWVFSAATPANADRIATLYQPGLEQSAKRLADAEGRAALEASISVVKRFAEQIPAGGGEVALLGLIRGLANGRPDYGTMVPEFAQRVRPVLSTLQESLVRLGNVQSMALEKVEASGNDVYDVKFAAGERDFSVLMDPDGRIHSAYFEP